MAPAPQAPNKLSSDEIWGQIPPEEKFELLAHSQSKGLGASLLYICAVSTVAVGLKFPWLIWVSILTSPMVYQFAAGKAWRHVKPKMMLEYLAARSVARRFAFATKAYDLGIQLLFHGWVERYREPTEAELEAAVQSIESAAKASLKWVGLLNTAVVAFNEGPGGARLEFVAPLDESVKLDVINNDEEGKDYTSKKELVLTIDVGTRQERRYKLTTPYPGCLVVFEKKFLALQDAHLKAKEALRKAQEEDGIGGDGLDDMSF